MSQISHWFDLSQVYNSKKASFDFLSRDKRNPSKVAGDSQNDGTKIMMPRCPADSRPFNLAKVAPNCTASNTVPHCTARIIPNACLGSCTVPSAQRTPTPAVIGTDPTAPPSRAPGLRDSCFIGGKLCILSNFYFK